MSKVDWESLYGIGLHEARNEVIKACCSDNSLCSCVSFSTNFCGKTSLEFGAVTSLSGEDNDASVGEWFAFEKFVIGGCLSDVTGLHVHGNMGEGLGRSGPHSVVR